MTTTVEDNLHSVKVNQHNKYQGQRTFCSKVIVRTDTHRNYSEPSST